MRYNSTLHLECRCFLVSVSLHLPYFNLLNLQEQAPSLLTLSYISSANPQQTPHSIRTSSSRPTPFALSAPPSPTNRPLCRSPAERLLLFYPIDLDLPEIRLEIESVHIRRNGQVVRLRSAHSNQTLEYELTKSYSQSKLSQQELQDLQKATHFDKKELQQWYKGWRGVSSFATYPTQV